MKAASDMALDEETAWRLFTTGISADVARVRVACSGDDALELRVLKAVAIIA